jgi:hypothetical protein
MFHSCDQHSTGLTNNSTYQQLDSSPKPQQIARLSKMVQELEKILSKKTGRKHSESAPIVSKSKTGASGVLSSCARNIPGASKPFKITGSKAKKFIKSFFLEHLL